jgi:hypothetical protein
MNNHYYIYKYTTNVRRAHRRGPRARRCCIAQIVTVYRTALYAAAAALQLAWCDHDNTRVADQQHAV